MKPIGWQQMLYLPMVVLCNLVIICKNAMIVSGEKVSRWVCKRLNSGFNESSQGIGLERNGILIAGVYYENWNHRTICASIVAEGKLTPRFLYAIFHYPFEHLSVEKIYCQVIECNNESIRLLGKMGFTRETTLSDAHPDGDIFLYSLKRQDCRFTGDRYGKRQLTTSNP